MQVVLIQDFMHFHKTKCSKKSR